MRNFDVHVCLVSDQALPNLIPVLASPSLPRKVILLVSDEKQCQAKYLASALKESGIKDIEFVTVADVYSPNKMREDLLQLLTDDHYFSEGKQTNIALNATGGTKLMSMAAFEMFSSEKWPCFYYQDSGKLIYLNDESLGEARPKKMRIEQCLTAHGVGLAQPLQRTDLISHRELTDKIMQGGFQDEIAALNGVLAKTYNKNTGEADYPKSANQQKLDVLVDFFEQYGLLKTEGRKKLHFESEQKYRCVHGGWFEEYVFRAINKIAGVQDCALAAKVIYSSNSGNEAKERRQSEDNDLDVVLMYNNRLHIIECKTKNYNEMGNEKELNEARNKLETLKKVGGSSSKVAFVSYQRFKKPESKQASQKQQQNGRKNEKKSKTIQEKFSAAGIALFEQQDVRGLDAWLEKFLNSQN
ncbi:MAG: DUF1887 family CARF protein [Neisseria sp.]|nr:DUF1887 family CARF protein [Neisseria sp.]